MAEKTVQAHKAYSADLFKDAEKNPENLLVVKNLKKYFPIKSSFFKMTVGNVKAVDGVSFVIKKGTTMGLVGESGCGKSTIGRTILRLIEKTEGEVYFNGQDIFKLSKSELRAHRPNIQIIVKPVGSSGSNDPLNQRGTIAWKVPHFACAIIQDDFIIRIEHGVSD